MEFRYRTTTIQLESAKFDLEGWIERKVDRQLRQHMRNQQDEYITIVWNDVEEEDNDESKSKADNGSTAGQPN